MNSRRLVMLIAALAVLVALAVAVSVSQRKGGEAGMLLPDLKARLNDIDKIVVRTAGDKTIATLARQQGGWVLVERDSYPADVGRIRKDLIALAEAKMLEEKTSNPELYNKLGVDDIAKETAGGVQLDLAAGDKVTSVIVGNTGVGGGERAYARRAGEPTSWLVTGNFEVPREAAEWLDKGLTNIAAKRVQAVTITHAAGPALRLEKASADATDFTVLDVPANRALSFPGVGNAIGAALSELNLETVEPASAFAPGNVKAVVARFENFDGLIVEASTYQLPAGGRVRFSASADPALAARFAPKPAEPKPADEKDGKAADQAPPAPDAEKPKSFDEVKAEAAEINARLGNWVYSLPDFKGEQLTKKLDDLLQPLPAKGAPPKPPGPRLPALPQSPVPG